MLSPAGRSDPGSHGSTHDGSESFVALGEWAQQHFAGDSAAIDAAKRALVAGAKQADVAELAKAWKDWGRRTFPSDDAKALAAASAAFVASVEGHSSEESVSAGRKAADQITSHPLSPPHSTAAQTPSGRPTPDDTAGHAPAARSSDTQAQPNPRAPNGAHSGRSSSRPEPGPEMAGLPLAAKVRDPDSLGAYEYLRRDNSALSQEAARLIDELQISGHPRLSAFLGRRSPGRHSKRAKAMLAASALAWLLIIATHIPAVRKVDGPVSPVPIGVAVAISIAFVAAGALLYGLYAATTKYTLARGRLTVESGLLARNSPSYELYRISDVVVHRSLPNRLTGDGTLQFHYVPASGGEAKVIPVTGLQPYDQLEDTRKGLMNLIFVLRSTPVIQRYMQ